VTLKTLAIQGALVAKGFIKDNTDHKMFWLYLDGKKTSVRTKISHGEKEIDDFLIGQMSKQIRLKKPQFVDFVKCPLSAEAYAELVRGTLAGEA
jgi:hypothetical protein